MFFNRFRSVAAIISLVSASAVASTLPFVLINSDQGLVEFTRENNTVLLKEWNTFSAPWLVLQGPFSRCTWAGKPCSGTKWRLDLPSGVPTESNTIFTLRLEEKGKTESYDIRLVRKDFPWFRTQGSSVLSEPIIFSSSSLTSQKERCDLVILDPKGKILFHRQLEKICIDFRPHLVSGERFYSYQEVSRAFVLGGTVGPRVILNENLEPVRTIDHNFDGHEFHMIAEDHWLSVEVQLDRLRNGLVYLNKRIRERKAGKIIFDWGVSDFIEQTGTEAMLHSTVLHKDSESVLNLMHVNSVYSLKDSILVGLGTNGICHLSRVRRTCDWILGGASDQFKLTLLQHPIFQHSAALIGSKLYLFSNYTAPMLLQQTSRVLVYDLDVNARKVKSFTVLRSAKEQTYLMGSLQLKGEVLSIGTGLRIHPGADFIEQKNTEETFRLNFISPDEMVYRFYREPFGEQL